MSSPSRCGCTPYSEGSRLQSRLATRANTLVSMEGSRSTIVDLDCLTMAWNMTGLTLRLITLTEKANRNFCLAPFRCLEVCRTFRRKQGCLDMSMSIQAERQPQRKAQPTNISKYKLP